MRALGDLAWGFFGALAAFALLSVLEVEWPARMQPLSGGLQVKMTYVDFLTVMFAGATFFLAALALLVGLVAIFTYQGIKNEAQRTIRTTVDAKMPEIRGDAQQTIQRAVDERLADLDARIEREVGEEAEDKIARAFERAGRDGALDQALQRALVAINMGIGGAAGAADELEEDEDR